MPAEGADEEAGAQEGAPEDFEEESRDPKLLRSLVAPTRAEREEHEITHMSYRDRCPHCVRGRGNIQPHRQDKSEDSEGAPTVAMDYGFMRAQSEEEQMSPMLVIKENGHGLVFAAVVPAKGNAHPWIAKRCYRWIEGIGYPKVVIKSDNEPSITALTRDMACRKEDGAVDIVEPNEGSRKMEIFPENAEVGESQINGLVERAVASMEGMVRTLKAPLEARIGMKLPPTSNALKWLVEHAAYLYNRHKVGPDGKTPYERWKSKRAKRTLCEFGERVLYLPLKGARNGKLEAKFEYGIFVGVLERSGEAIISTEAGMVKARTVKRLLEENRWKPELVINMVGTPWALQGDDKERPIGIKIDMEEPSGEVPEMPEMPLWAKRMTMKRSDFLDYGFTEGCRGCNAIRRGQPRRITARSAGSA